MDQVLLFTILTLCMLGVLSAVILYFVAQKFKVYEDPRIDSVEGMLPGANCGGCGFAGCRALADALVKEDDISALNCPVGGGDCMKAIASFLGKAAPERDPQVAVVRCAGSCEKRPRTNLYDGAKSCAVIASTYGGETGCNYGCLGQGDCVVVCNFGAIEINPLTGLPEVNEEKCTACGACVKACPKMIIELRKKGIKNRRIYVACANKDKGAIARKSCSTACIGCGKCVKSCEFGAITMKDNLAYIDADLCKLCRKCASECPTGAIVELNFPPRAPKKDKPVAPATTPVEKAISTPPVSTSAPIVPFGSKAVIDPAKVAPHPDESAMAATKSVGEKSTVEIPSMGVTSVADHHDGDVSSVSSGGESFGMSDGSHDGGGHVGH